MLNETNTALAARNKLTTLLIQTKAQTPVEYIVLHGEYRIPIDFYNSIKVKIEYRLPSLGHGPKFTAKNLCGKDFWSLLTRGACRLAGMCVVHLVENGHLPLIPVKHAHEYPKKYQLK